MVMCKQRLARVWCSSLLVHQVCRVLMSKKESFILTIVQGFGNRCQHLIYELARAAGISDLAARTPRSRNKMNVVKAAFEALMSQRLPEEVAKARGKKMVDVRKVYYGGKVY
jgi:ribosomal protein S5